MVGHPETRKSDLVCYSPIYMRKSTDIHTTSQVCAFFSTEANEEGDYSDKETEVNDTERKRQIAKSTPLPSQKQPS